LTAKCRLTEISNPDGTDSWRLWRYCWTSQPFGAAAEQSLCLERAADYLAKHLKGEKVRNLPVQQATSFELIVNSRTASALGLTVPPNILLRADEVIG
jgi:hypothetical protein